MTPLLIVAILCFHQACADDGGSDSDYSMTLVLGDTNRQTLSNLANLNFVGYMPIAIADEAEAIQKAIKIFPKPGDKALPGVHTNAQRVYYSSDMNYFNAPDTNTALIPVYATKKEYEILLEYGLVPSNEITEREMLSNKPTELQCCANVPVVVKPLFRFPLPKFPWFKPRPVPKPIYNS